MTYRLHIDIPIEDTDLELAKSKAKKVFDTLLNDDSRLKLQSESIKQINYRLGHDDDRQKSNYFQLDKRGHVNNKKSVFEISNEMSS